MGEPLMVGDDCRVNLVPVPDAIAEPYYSSFCNPILWFIQHGLAEQLTSPDLAQEASNSWLAGYVPVNRLFAEAVIAEMDCHAGPARVMLHDYHLYLAPRLIRRARPDAHLQQFVHIPWPRSDAWAVLPAWLVKELCKGLLANDSLAFQTAESVSNFIATCEAYLPGEIADSGADLTFDGRDIHVWSNPISVDPLELSSLGGSPELAQLRASLRAPFGVQTIVRVDRLDPAKNVLRGFQAFELLLEKRPDLHRRVRFNAFLVPSRSGIPEYDSYVRDVFRLVELINSRYGAPDWTPITVFHEQNRAQALAGLSLYDVLLVNSIADGMNLVSKEGPLLNEKDGVICLSTAAGSFEQLHHGVIAVDPLDVRKTAQALEVALELRPEVRSTMASMTRSAIESHQLTDWLRHLIQDLDFAAWKKEQQLVHI
jgi:trehalose 6-phosphate synthase